ncbi:609_t:CDS:1, partial [Entrophospora sp. SA101]
FCPVSKSDLDLLGCDATEARILLKLYFGLSFFQRALQKLPTTIHQEKLPSQMLNSNRLL